MRQLTPAGELWWRQRGVTLCERPSESRTPFLLEVATPERLLVRERVSETQIPAKGGYVGFLPRHAALLRSWAKAS